MECPSESFLERFVRDPDAALVDVPSFEEHLAECKSCQHGLDDLANRKPRLRHLEMVIGSSPPTRMSYPELDGYKIHELIGTGGFGSVYRGTHIESGRPVAIKIIRSLDPNDWKRISLERDTLIRADHPNIVTLLDFGNRPAYCFFVYRWMETSLARHLQTVTFVDISQTTQWMIQIVDAVAYVHELGIVHRDLKPSNVLLSASGVPKLIDFGIAKEISIGSQAATGTQPLGTPGFMAPEQTGMIGEPVGFKTDVYGLGALLYTLLTGRAPFMGSTSLPILHQVVHDAPIPLKKLRAEIDCDLETICLKCLNKKPTDRYASAKDVADDLRRFRDGKPIHAKPLSWIRRAVYLVRSHPIASAIAMGALLLCIGTVFIAYQAREVWKHSFQLAATQSLLTNLVNAEPSELERLYSEVERVSGRLQSEAYTQILRSSVALTEKSRVRLRCVEGIPAELSVHEFLAAIQVISPNDILQLVNRFKPRSESEKQQFIAALAKTLQESNDGGHALCTASFLLRLDPNCDCITANSSKLLEAMRNSSALDQMIWQKTLQPARRALSEELVRRLKSSQTNEIDWSSLQRIALGWNSDDTETQMAILQNGTYRDLEAVKSLEIVSAQGLLRACTDSWESMRQLRLESLKLPRLSDALNAIGNRYGGIQGKNRLFLLDTTREDFDPITHALRQLGYSLQSIESRRIDGQKLVALSFEKTDEASEVTWDQAIDGITELQSERKRDGWQPIAIWPDGTEPTIDVVWRKSARISNSILNSLSSITEAIDSIPARSISIEGCEVCTHSLQTGSVIAISKERPSSDPLSFQSASFSKVIEFTIPLDDRSIRKCLTKLSEQEELLSQQFPMSSSHEELFRYLESLGFELKEVFYQGDTGSGVWRRDLSSADQFNIHQAKCSLICWILGNVEPALDELRMSHDPGVRAILVDWICRLDRTPTRLVKCLGLATDNDQLQALLIAASKFHMESLTPTSRLDLVNAVKPFVENKDSAIHAAAKWLFVNLLNQPDKEKDMILRESSISHRSWYVSPSGLTFVVINPSELQFLGDDLRVPWLRDNNHRLHLIQRTFSIQSTEVTERMFREFLFETRLALNTHSIANSVLDGPATRHLYIEVLKFCRWLSERDGIEPSSIGLPTINEIRPGMRLPSDFLERDGYRLPTPDEWEIAVRAGTVTSNFFGDSMEPLSTYGWNSNNTQLHVESVGRLAPNPWGLFDVVGNAFEMMLGDANCNCGSTKQLTDIDWVFKEDMHVCARGGSFLSNRIYCSPGSRHNIPAGANDMNVGFRLVRIPRTNGTQ